MTSTEDSEKNDAQAMRLVEVAVKQGATFVCLPECFHMLGRNANESRDVAKRYCIEEYQKLAKRLGVWLSLGGIHRIKDKEVKMSNVHVILNDGGEVVCEYEKIHLFDVKIPGRVSLMESESTKPGDYLKICNTPFGKLGLSVCYDVRFPELYSRLAEAGAEILLIPAAFTQTTGMAHWEVLLRARAIENQCYVLASAQTGRHNEKRVSYGDAMIVDPWGTVRARGGSTTENLVLVTDIDLKRQRQIRKSMPKFSHRRPDIYRSKVIMSNI